MPEVLNNSLFKIQDVQAVAGQQVINRYWYIVNVTPETLTASELLTAFEAHFATVLPAMQSNITTHVTTSVEEVTSITNFLEADSGIADGALAGAAIPSFLAAKVRLFRTTKETRSGWKRPYAGTENELTGNVWTGSFVNTIQAYADRCALPISTTVGPATPCIVRETVDVVTGEPRAASFWIYNLVSSAQALTQVSSQNTRKPGRGS